MQFAVFLLLLLPEFEIQKKHCLILCKPAFFGAGLTQTVKKRETYECFRVLVPFASSDVISYVLSNIAWPY